VEIKLAMQNIAIQGAKIYFSWDSIMKLNANPSMTLSDPKMRRISAKKREEQFEPSHNTPWGVIVEVDSSTSPPNRPNMTWVDMYNQQQRPFGGN
jgi:hypothetical protein